METLSSSDLEPNTLPRTDVAGSRLPLTSCQAEHNGLALSMRGLLDSCRWTSATCSPIHFEFLNHEIAARTLVNLMRSHLTLLSELVEAV